MQSIVWWSNLVVLVAASVIDLRTRRVPNWLVVPFLVSGLAVQSVTNGWSGAGRSLSGVGLAVLLFGVPCCLRGMGMGDLKLAAGVGAWIGPSQFFLAFVVTGIAGAVLAGSYALFHGSLGRCLDNTGDLLAHLGKSGLRPHAQVRLDNGAALSIPYAPAIAIGTLLSFLGQ
jgi:prepilin peptidase CpaA